MKVGTLWARTERDHADDSSSVRVRHQATNSPSRGVRPGCGNLGPEHSPCRSVLRRCRTRSAKRLPLRVHGGVPHLSYPLRLPDDSHHHQRVRWPRRGATRPCGCPGDAVRGGNRHHVRHAGYDLRAARQGVRHLPGQPLGGRAASPFLLCHGGLYVRRLRLGIAIGAAATFVTGGRARLPGRVPHGPGRRTHRRAMHRAALGRDSRLCGNHARRRAGFLAACDLRRWDRRPLLGHRRVLASPAEIGGLDGGGEECLRHRAFRGRPLLPKGRGSPPGAGDRPVSRLLSRGRCRGRPGNSAGRRAPVISRGLAHATTQNARGRARGGRPVRRDQLRPNPQERPALVAHGGRWFGPRPGQG